MIFKHFIQCFLFCYIFLLFFGCPALPKPGESGTTSSKNSENIKSTDKCNTFATVKDMTGLDGCKLMLILYNGKKFLPVKIQDESFKLKAGQTVEFAYEILEDMMGICMAQDEMVIVTCIREIQNKQQVAEKCIKATSPYDLKWLKSLEAKIKPFQINRYNYKKEYAYLFKTKSKQYLYDCHANLICEIEGKKNE